MSDTTSTDGEWFREAREVLLAQPKTSTDWSDLVDYVDRLEEEGYRGELHLDPDAREEDVIFEVALAVGYACGLRGGEQNE